MKYATFKCLKCKKPYGWPPDTEGCVTCGLCKECIDKKEGRTKWTS